MSDYNLKSNCSDENVNKLADKIDTYFESYEFDELEGVARHGFNDKVVFQFIFKNNSVTNQYNYTEYQVVVKNKDNLYYVMIKYNVSDKADYGNYCFQMQDGELVLVGCDSTRKTENIKLTKLYDELLYSLIDKDEIVYQYFLSLKRNRVEYSIDFIIEGMNQDKKVILLKDSANQSAQVHVEYMKSINIKEDIIEYQILSLIDSNDVDSRYFIYKTDINSKYVLLYKRNHKDNFESKLISELSIDRERSYIEGIKKIFEIIE